MLMQGCATAFPVAEQPLTLLDELGTSRCARSLQDPARSEDVRKGGAPRFTFLDETGADAAADSENLLQESTCSTAVAGTAADAAWWLPGC